MKIEDLLSQLDKSGIRYCLTGSAFICDPPVIDTDIDVVALIEEAPMHFSLRDWAREGSDNYEGGSDFTSYRRGNINLIVVHSEAIFERWLLATEVGKKLNLINRDDRVTLFKSILYGE